MKLATKAYIVTLVLLVLAFSVPAQKRSDKDDRNTAPTVGTGGPVGGPTGLFTVYDGQTLRKGEYTLSAALSNYDRDPGNADISSVPLSFQFGVTNHLELFFTTEGYRGIKINSPQNLSSFYLPNSTLLVNGVNMSPGAIVLAPGTSGPYVGMAVFRPFGSPSSVFPYIGGNAGTYGIPLPFFSGPFFGFPAGTNALLGTPVRSTSGGADLFPGVGSVYGSLLPGIVLRTQNLTLPNGNPAGVGPLTFSAAPTYLADAPFDNRPYASSSFNTVDFGFKWRFNSVNSAWGHGITAFYRWYLDRATSPTGFNMMERGSGPGDSRGDIGVTYFADARVTKWANVSGNVGYVFTTKVKANMGGAQYTILDPGDELHLAVGVDFPVNKYFQPILEYRYLRYVGGRTPNALEQNPMDTIAGFRVYPRRWFGFGLAWRYNVNQEDDKSFGSNVSTGNTVLVCGPLSAANCTSSTLTRSSTGVPLGFVTSNDPHGYIAQLWFGRRDKRAGPIVNQPANVDSVSLSATTITLGCGPGTTSTSGSCSDSVRTISVATKASDPENDVLTYNYTVSGGRIVGTGANVQWDLSTATTGTYTITTGVDDGCGVCGRTNTQTIRVVECPDCKAPAPTCNCGSLSVSGPSGITNPGDAMSFTATVSGGSATNLTYNWSVSAGTIESGQGTPSISVRTNKDMAGANVTATVHIGGTDPTCNCDTDKSETAGVAAAPTNKQVDEFGALKPDDLKARFDNFYIQLNNDPTSRGYVVIYGTAAQIKAERAAMNKAIAFRKYDASRLTFIDGPPQGAAVDVKLYIVPTGATPPTP